MTKDKKNFIEAEDVNLFNYELTKRNVDELFSKYRSFKNKIDMIQKRYNASLSLDNLGIYSSAINNPTQNKVEQSEKYRNFIETIEGIYKLNYKELSKDELIIYDKYICDKCTDEDLAEYLSISRTSVFPRKRSCYIKVAKWFDLEVFK